MQETVRLSGSSQVAAVCNSNNAFDLYSQPSAIQVGSVTTQ
jgi:hypothetical protein